MNTFVPLNLSSYRQLPFHSTSSSFGAFRSEARSLLAELDLFNGRKP
jgi:hypothetical protein